LHNHIEKMRDVKRAAEAKKAAILKKQEEATKKRKDEQKKKKTHKDLFGGDYDGVGDDYDEMATQYEGSVLRSVCLRSVPSQQPPRCLSLLMSHAAYLPAISALIAQINMILCDGILPCLRSFSFFLEHQFFL
jgi:hypothetical protein